MGKKSNNSNNIGVVRTHKFSAITILGDDVNADIQGPQSSTTMSAYELEARIKALENGRQYEANKAAVEKVQGECLQTLRQVREAFTQPQTNSNGGGMVGVVAPSEVQEENEKLKAKVAKLEYRVQHMVSSIETLLLERKTEKQ